MKIYGLLLLLWSAVNAQQITYDDSDFSFFTYSPAEVWFHEDLAQPALYNGTQSYSSDTAALFSFVFTGVGFEICAGLKADRSTFNVTIDSVYNGEGSQYSSTATDAAPACSNVYSVSNLTYGSHTAVIQNTGSAYLALDSATIDETDPASVVSSSSSSLETSQSSQTSASSSSFATSTSSSSSSLAPSAAQRGTSHTGAIAGGVVGGVAAILIVLGLLFLLSRRRRRQRTAQRGRHYLSGTSQTQNGGTAVDRYSDTAPATGKEKPEEDVSRQYPPSSVPVNMNSASVKPSRSVSRKPAPAA